ncbi:hypothetical protein Agub_g10898, partial [Astrephomene gubernaculifera]
MLCERPEVVPALKGAIVVLPAVTYANVGELAVDVLVATLCPQPLGSLESANVLPVVGNDAFSVGPGTLSTALEAFSLPGRPLVLLQQRAPACPGRQAAWAAELVAWLAGCGAAGVLLLSGLDAQLRRDKQLDSDPCRFLASSDALRDAVAAASLPPTAQQQQQQQQPDLDQHMQESLVLQPPQLQPPQQSLPELEPEIREEELALHHSLPPWPLVQECTARGLPYIMLGCFAAEG